MKSSYFKIVLGAWLVLAQSGCAQLLYSHTPAPVYTSRAPPVMMARPQPPQPARPSAPQQPAPLQPAPGVMLYKLNPLEAQPFVQQEALTPEVIPVPVDDTNTAPSATPSTPAVTEPSSAAQAIAPVAPPPPPMELPVAASPPVLALLTEAQNNHYAGKTEVAVAALERALRIEPRNPGLFYRLSALRLQQEQPHLAEELAKKALSLAGQDARLKRHCWLLIENARRKRGDLAGAEEAQRNAQAF